MGFEGTRTNISPGNIHRC